VAVTDFAAGDGGHYNNRVMCSIAPYNPEIVNCGAGMPII